MSQRWSLDTHYKREAFNAHINQLVLAGKKPIVQFITNQDNPKTPSQVRYMHSLIHALADYKKVDFEIAKKDCKVAFGVVVVSSSCVDGSRTARLKSFSDYTREESIGFIGAMEAHLMENGVPFTPATL